MAKHSSGSGERSKVRIFFVEADLGPGDMQDLTHALTTAMRPYGTSPRTMFGKVPPPPAPAADGEQQVEPGEADLVVDEPSPTSVTRQAHRARSYRKPVPVDMDMKAGGLAFVEYAKQKAPTAHRAKYLVAAAWLHEYASEASISADHVFTCYKAAGWTFDVQDPSAPLRQLKMDGFGTLKRGIFSINHLGIAEVEKMGSE